MRKLTIMMMLLLTGLVGVFAGAGSQTSFLNSSYQATAWCGGDIGQCNATDFCIQGTATCLSTAGGGSDNTTWNESRANTLYVSDVTGSSPIVSSGGLTPAISATIAKDLVTTAPLTGAVDNIFLGTDSDITIAMPVATTSADGYLSQTDWDTFNGKYGSTANVEGAGFRTAVDTDSLILGNASGGGGGSAFENVYAKAFVNYYDNDTNITMTANRIEYSAGNPGVMKVEGQTLYGNYNVNADTNFYWFGDASDYLIATDVANERVGIGINNPSVKLEVEGNVKADEGSFIRLTATQTTTTGFTGWFTRNLASGSTNNNVVQITQDNSGDDQEALVIQQDSATAVAIALEGTNTSVSGIDCLFFNSGGMMCSGS